MDIDLDNIDYFRTVSLQSANQSKTLLNFNFTTKNYGINFVPDICIIRNVTWIIYRTSNAGYAYGGPLLLWSNLTNNYIAALNLSCNVSNFGGNFVSGFFCQSSPNNVIKLKNEIPTNMTFAFHTSLNDATNAFGTSVQPFVNGFFEMTIDFIKFKEPKLLLSSN